MIRITYSGDFSTFVNFALHGASWGNFTNCNAGPGFITLPMWSMGLLALFQVHKSKRHRTPFGFHVEKCSYMLLHCPVTSNPHLFDSRDGFSPEGHTRFTAYGATRRYLYACKTRANKITISSRRCWSLNSMHKTISVPRGFQQQGNWMSNQFRKGSISWTIACYRMESLDGTVWIPWCAWLKYLLL